MALARVVTFDGVSKDRMDAMNAEMQGREPPEGLNAKEIVKEGKAGAPTSARTLIAALNSAAPRDTSDRPKRKK